MLIMKRSEGGEDRLQFGLPPLVNQEQQEIDKGIRCLTAKGLLEDLSLLSRLDARTLDKEPEIGILTEEAADERDLGGDILKDLGISRRLEESLSVQGWNLFNQHS